MQKRVNVFHLRQTPFHTLDSIFKISLRAGFKPSGPFVGFSLLSSKNGIHCQWHCAINIMTYNSKRQQKKKYNNFHSLSHRERMEQKKNVVRAQKLMFTKIEAFLGNG